MSQDVVKKDRKDVTGQLVFWPELVGELQVNKEGGVLSGVVTVR